MDEKQDRRRWAIIVSVTAVGSVAALGVLGYAYYDHVIASRQCGASGHVYNKATNDPVSQAVVGYQDPNDIFFPAVAGTLATTSPDGSFAFQADCTKLGSKTSSEITLDITWGKYTCESAVTLKGKDHRDDVSIYVTFERLEGGPLPLVTGITC